MHKTYPVSTTISQKPQVMYKELPEEVFQYPFFNDGVLASNVIETKRNFSLDKNNEKLELKGLIFNISHCGSTLLSNMLGQLEGVKMVSEPEAINGLLLSKVFYGIKEEEIIHQLQQIVNLYQQKVQSKQFLILKLTSWNIYMIQLFQKAFPNVKWIFLDRDTASLLQSLKKSDGGFIDWWQHPVDNLRKHFIEEEQHIINKEAYLKALIKGHRKHANTNKNANGLFIEYPNFIHQYEAILNHLELKYSSNEILASKEILKYDSKSMNKTVWKNKNTVKNWDLTNG